MYLSVVSCRTKKDLTYSLGFINVRRIAIIKAIVKLTHWFSEIGFGKRKLNIRPEIVRFITPQISDVQMVTAHYAYASISTCSSFFKVHSS